MTPCNKELEMFSFRWPALKVSHAFFFITTARLTGGNLFELDAVVRRYVKLGHFVHCCLTCLFTACTETECTQYYLLCIQLFSYQLSLEMSEWTRSACGLDRADEQMFLVWLLLENSCITVYVNLAFSCLPVHIWCCSCLDKSLLQFSKPMC